MTTSNALISSSAFLTSDSLTRWESITTGTACHLDAQRESLKITQARFDAGLTSALDVAQAESNLGRSEAEVPLLSHGAPVQ